MDQADCEKGEKRFNLVARCNRVHNAATPRARDRTEGVHLDDVIADVRGAHCSGETVDLRVKRGGGSGGCNLGNLPSQRCGCSLRAIHPPSPPPPN